METFGHHYYRIKRNDLVKIDEIIVVYTEN